MTVKNTRGIGSEFISIFIYIIIYINIVVFLRGGGMRILTVTLYYCAEEDNFSAKVFVNRNENIVPLHCQNK